MWKRIRHFFGKHNWAYQYSGKGYGVKIVYDMLQCTICKTWYMCRVRHGELGYENYERPKKFFYGLR